MNGLRTLIQGPTGCAILHSYWPIRRINLGRHRIDREQEPAWVPTRGHCLQGLASPYNNASSTQHRRHGASAMSPRHIPNLISLCRIGLVYPVIHAILARTFDTAIALFIVAGLSDGIDGFLARRYGWQSRLGSHLDPIADKLLLVFSYLALASLHLIPVWLAALVVVRDVFILAGAVAYYWLIGPYVGAATRLSKINTAAQLCLIAALLVHPGLMTLPSSVLSGLMGLVVVTTLGSGLDYVVRWGRLACRLRRESAGRRPEP